MYETDYTTSSDTGASSTAKETAKQATGSAKQAAGEVTDTVKEQGRQVAGEVKGQVRSVASDVRQSVTGQVRTGHGKLAESVRKFADEFGNLSGAESTSPVVGQVVSRVSETGRRAADYLDDRGPEGLLDDVQNFARRKPGTFLLAAAAAGFVIGRLGRSTVAAARDETPTATPTGAQGLYTGTGYDAGAGYDATTPAYATTTGYDTTAGTTATGTTTTGYATPPVAGATFVEDTYPTPTYDPRTSDATAVGTAPVDPAVDPVEYDQSGYPIGTRR